MKQKDPLETYGNKRDFTLTPEPAGTFRERRPKRSIFVIHKHDASRLHYDFRIGAAGLLKSWALPKGPSTNPKDKRLAMPTEDHPMEYAKFEGVIPEADMVLGRRLFGIQEPIVILVKRTDMKFQSSKRFRRVESRFGLTARNSKEVMPSRGFARSLHAGLL